MTRGVASDAMTARDRVVAALCACVALALVHVAMMFKTSAKQRRRVRGVVRGAGRGRVIGFYHPSGGDGGGGERVLFAAIETASDAQRKDLHVVLVTPKIPGNTGCIARTCAASRVPLHLVAPLGFSLDDAQLKRAGLDYWKSVCVKVHDDWDAFYAYWRELGDERGRLVAFSKFGARPHAEDGAYRPGDWLLFGAETTGLPDAAMEACKATGGVRRIPIDESHVRSLNLSVSCGIGVYEALRQLDGSPTVDE